MCKGRDVRELGGFEEHSNLAFCLNGAKVHPQAGRCESMQ